jgi:AraC-like DNA-binding protein
MKSLTRPVMAKQLSKFYLYQQIVQAKLFIDSNFMERITIDEVAGKSFFSKFHFIRLFKTVYGTTPHQYLISVRIAKAKLLLQAGLPVAEVCNAVGFESTTSFSGIFKQVVAATPNGYKKEQAERRDELQKTPLKFVPYCFAKQCGRVR